MLNRVQYVPVIRRGRNGRLDGKTQAARLGAAADNRTPYADELAGLVRLVTCKMLGGRLKKKCGGA